MGPGANEGACGYIYLHLADLYIYIFFFMVNVDDLSDFK